MDEALDIERDRNEFLLKQLLSVEENEEFEEFETQPLKNLRKDKSWAAQRLRLAERARKEHEAWKEENESKGNSPN